MDALEAAKKADQIGNIATVLSILIPAVIWWIIYNIPKPKSRLQYSLRFSTWPLILWSSVLAGPITREIYGLSHRYGQSIDQALQGVIGVSFIFGSIFFLIGYLIIYRHNK